MSCSSYAGYTEEEKARLVRDGPHTCNHCTREAAQAHSAVAELEQKKQEVERRLNALLETQGSLNKVMMEAHTQLALKKLSTSKQRYRIIQIAQDHYEQAVDAHQRILQEIQLLESEIFSVEADLQVLQETYRQTQDASASCKQDSERFLQST